MQRDTSQGAGRDTSQCAWCGNWFLTPFGKYPALCQKCRKEVRQRERGKKKKKMRDVS